MLRHVLRFRAEFLLENLLQHVIVLMRMSVSVRHNHKLFIIHKDFVVAALAGIKEAELISVSDVIVVNRL